MKRTIYLMLAVMMILLLTACDNSGKSTVQVYDAVTDKYVDLIMNSETVKSNKGWMLVEQSTKTIYEFYEEAEDNNTAFDVRFFSDKDVLIYTNNSDCPVILITRQFDKETAENYSSMVVITSETFNFAIPKAEADVSSGLNFDDYESRQKNIYYPIHLTNHKFSYSGSTLKGNSENPFTDDIELIYVGSVYMPDKLYSYYNSIPRYSVVQDNHIIHVTDEESGFAFRIEYNDKHNTMKYYAE